MRRIVAATIGFALAIPASAGAHRLDELLQATRVAVARDRVAIEIDLTPGVTVAPDIYSLIDRDADRQISGAEAEAYARGVLSEVVLEGDGHALSLTLTRVEVPSRFEMSEGVGTIRIEAVAGAPAASAGRHRLVFRNAHESWRSVYLVNALIPRSPGIAIRAQARDPRQREIRIEYVITSGGGNPSALPDGPARAGVSWLLAGALTLSALAVFRRRRPDPPRGAPA